MTSVQFYSVEPNALIKEIAENVKTELLAELTKILETTNKNVIFPQMKFANTLALLNPHYTIGKTERL
jgi:hypothetical protein